MQPQKDALALQSEFKGRLYTQKLPINRTSGHYSIISATRPEPNVISEVLGAAGRFGQTFLPSSEGFLVPALQLFRLPRTICGDTV